MSMNKRLVLAEKPSVGRELARVLGCRTRAQGYLEGPDHIVTWALGHLIELAEPAAYGQQYRRWDLAVLPMLPSSLKQEVIEQTADQYGVIESLLKREDVDCVVIATDAGREGELVARWILAKALWNKATKRLWISSQTDTAITEGFSKLKDGSLYDNLFKAAQSRAAADWYIGMNVTRALTCRYDAKLSAGRVQTPTLAFMTRCEDDIEKFTGTFYWTLRADFGSFMASWQDEGQSIRIDSEQKANEIKGRLEGKTGLAAVVETVEKHEGPPLAYDLTELQRDANLLLSFSAKETLDILQKLYEVHKIVTYPRTDSRYISDDIVATLPSRLKALERTPFAKTASLLLSAGFRVDTERFVQAAKVTDHHAIIPTEQAVDLDKLSPNERSLWQLIAIRFIEVLSPDYVYRTTKLEALVGQDRFVARLTVPVEQGWRDVARIVGMRSALAPEGSQEDTDTSLASLRQGDPLTVYGTRIRRNATEPPERYTEATLLSAMEHAGRFVEDAALRKRLGGGLGTPATRADIIEKLVQNHYIEREGKYLVATPKGRELVRLAPPLLQSPELTARWEDRLAAIAEGEESDAPFIEDIKRVAAQLVKDVVVSKEKFTPRFPDGKTCPFCSAAMMRFSDEFGQIHFLCQRLSCSYEEALVKRPIEHADAVQVLPPKPVQRDAQDADQAPAVRKRVVVVKKATVSKPQQQAWETVVKVVNPSKFRRFGADRRQDDQEASAGRSGLRTRTSVSAQEAYRADQEQTVTFADLLAASEKRKERDRKKTKKD
jgi:DNA topoisomerase-3